MDKNLKNLIDTINSDKERGVSNARSVKRHLVELEAVLDSGIPLKKFVEDLKESGFKCTYRTIQNILYLYRKNKKLNKLNTAQSPLKPNTQKEKDEVETNSKAKTTVTVDENPTEKPLIIKRRETTKTLAQIRAETEAFFKKDDDVDVPDIVKRQIEKLKKENAERERRKSNELG